MRPEDPRVGQTYRVHIPRRDNPAKHLTDDPARSDIALAQLALSCDTEFGLTITSVDVERLGDESTVTCVRVVDTAYHVRTPVAPDVAEAHALPLDVGYVVEGVPKDAATDELVQLLTEQAITVPVRWLLIQLHGGEVVGVQLIPGHDRAPLESWHGDLLRDFVSMSLSDSPRRVTAVVQRIRAPQLHLVR